MENLRVLDPIEDYELFKLAHAWRQPKPHLSAQQMTLETFASSDPTHLSIGLFNPDLVAVYFFCEWEPTRFEGHFTSKKGISRDLLLSGAKEVVEQLLTHGASEVSAMIRVENRPLRQFVTEIGMKCVGYSFFTCTTDLEQCNFFTVRNQRKVFTKYVKMKEDLVGPQRQETNFYTDSIRAE